MSRSRDISKILGATELSNTTNTRLLASDEDVGFDSAQITTIASGKGLSVYTTLDSLPVQSLTAGDQAYVESDQRLYISNGNGWYNVALINLTPTMSLDQSGTITLSTEGVATVVTITASDSDNPQAILSYSVESDGNGIGNYTLSQDSSVFTITPLSEDSGAANATFTLTFKTTDNINTATSDLDFSLTFSSIVDSSAETVLLMKADGNSATNAAITFQNSSDVSTGFTEAGTPQASTFSPYRSGGYSAYFDGNGDFLSASDDIQLRTSDFTIEAWVYCTNLANDSALMTIVSQRNSSSNYWRLGITQGTGAVSFRTEESTIMRIDNGSIPVNQWRHIAVTRSGNTTRLFINGDLQGTDVDSSVKDLNYTGVPIRIGSAESSPNYFWKGYIRDLRIVKGTAVYTSAFTPPTEALTAVSNTSLLACHLPYFADGSTSNYTITPSGNTSTQPFGPYDYEPWVADDHGGSVYFDGSGDYLDCGSALIPTSASSNWTVEFWFNVASNTTRYDFVCQYNIGGAGRMTINSTTSGQVEFFQNGLTPAPLTSSDTFKANTWNHVAVVNNSQTRTLYLNGISQGTATGSSSMISGYNTYIGYLYSQNNFYVNGYIADARITSTAVYTSNFTPSAASLSHITNTSLLMNNKSDANVYDAAAANRLTLYNGASSSTARRKFTTSSSVYFDGTNDYIRQDEVLDVFTSTSSPFTFEGWVNFNATGSGLRMIFGCNGADDGFNNLLFGHNGTGWRVNYNDTERTPTGTISTNTWYHFAVSYDGSTSRTFINGTLAHTESSVTFTDAFSDCVFLIGTEADAADAGSLANYGNFYLQDLRVSRVARYTANFTPPTAEFEL